MKSKIKESLEKRKAEISAGIILETEPLICKPTAQTPRRRPDFAPNPGLGTSPPQREPVERRTVDEFFKQPRKAAIYLIGHGPKREPRPVELQYMRISRYIGMLREAGSSFINISHEPYVDLNMRRYEYSGLADHFPQFEALLGAVHEYEVVFTDIVEIRDPRDAAYYIGFDIV